VVVVNRFLKNYRVTNYAGRSIYYGLGFVWLFWAPLVMFWNWPLGLATIVVFVLGLIDDMYGTGDSKGFRGHLKALLKGKVTTGFVKLFGISLVSFLYALYPHTYDVFNSYDGSGFKVFENALQLPAGLSDPKYIALALLVGAAIALTSNFLNLMDLRPGRAVKTYLLLISSVTIAIVGTVQISGAIQVYEMYSSSELLENIFSPWVAASFGLPLLIFALPMLLVALPDLKEKAMLGDAGANAAGFVAGAFIVMWLPLWALVIYLLLMLTLNLASEKISYSKVIDNNPLLKKIDNIGRLKNDE